MSFVAGTQAHTKEGLRPIEQVRVGDYVLSKLEDGSGDPTYKRVTRTFEQEAKEVWFVGYTDPYDKYYERFVIRTAEQPFYVKEMSNMTYYGIDDPEIWTCNTWKSTVGLYRHYLEGNPIVFELADGRKAVCSTIGPVLVAINESGDVDDVGVVYSQGDVGEGNEGKAISFSREVPDFFGYEPLGDKLLPAKLFAKRDDWSTGEQLEQLGPDAIANIASGYVPLLRNVYNLEVEDNHTYYVGKQGMLVHNTSHS